jgi:hypothetical protein
VFDEEEIRFPDIGVVMQSIQKRVPNKKIFCNFSLTTLPFEQDWRLRERKNNIA